MGTGVAIACLVALTACGRVGFDASSSDAGESGDDASVLDPRPTPACAGHDEDGDGVGDQCDRCPTVADNQDDLGEIRAGLAPDGIGDACDPRPALPGDYVAFFTPFTQEVTTPPIQFISTYSFAHPDVVRLGSASGEGSGRFDIGVPFTRAAFRFTVVQSAPSPMVKWVGLWTHVGADNDLSNAMFTQVTQAEAPDSTYYMKEAVAGLPDRASDPVQYGSAFAPGLDVELTIDSELATGNDARLSSVVNGVALDNQEVAMFLPQTGSFYLETYYAQADYAYLIIYAIH